MILGIPMDQRAATASEGLPTLDDLFRAAVRRTPDALAVVDPPDRDGFTDGVPRRLTFAEADAVVTSIAHRLLGFGLPADSIVAVQLPNIVEGVLTLLAVIRAGLIAAPLPLLWGRAEIITALRQIGARVLIAPGRVGAVDYGALSAQVAAEVFGVRFVCGFGSGLPDGVIPLDDAFDQPAPQSARQTAADRPGTPADHVAVVTFEVTTRGLVPVARSHAELMASGAMVVSEVGTGACGAIVGTLAASSIAGLAALVMPWLITGGKLVLHQAFAGHVLAAQRAAEGCGLLVLPGPLLGSLREAGLLDGAVTPAVVLAVWRSPEYLATSAALSEATINIVDLSVFGEIGMAAARRPADKADAPSFTATVPARRDTASTMRIEATRTTAGTLALRGATVPSHPFPPGADRIDPLRLKIDEHGFVDTFYPCRHDRELDRLVITGPPAGLVNVGGYRFSLLELQTTVRRIDQEASVAALPDTMSGHRLAGLASDREAVRDALAAEGANPLLVAAFRERRAIQPDPAAQEASAA